MHTTAPGPLPGPSSPLGARPRSSVAPRAARRARVRWNGRPAASLRRALARACLALLAACTQLAPSSALADDGDKAGDRALAAGKELLGEAEDAKALRAFEKALELRKSDGAPAAKLAEVHVYIGITHFNLLAEKQAREHFRKALELDADVTLPDAVSPKIAEAFAEMKSELKNAKPSDEPDESAPAAATQPSPIAPQRDELSAVGQLWPAWTTLAVAAAAGGVGLALGLLAKSKADDSQDKRFYYREALSLHDKATGLALGANILYGVAGAAAVASAVLFYFGITERQRVRRASAAVAPRPGGAMVTVQGVIW